VVYNKGAEKIRMEDQMNKEIVDQARLEFHEANKTDDWKLIEKKWKTYESVFELWIRGIERND
jgi:hypothetical protein